MRPAIHLVWLVAGAIRFCAFVPPSSTSALHLHMHLYPHVNLFPPLHLLPSSASSTALSAVDLPHFLFATYITPSTNMYCTICIACHIVSCIMPCIVYYIMHDICLVCNQSNLGLMTARAHQRKH